MEELYKMSDADLLVWLTNFIAVGTTNAGDLTLTPAQLLELNNLRDTLQAAVNAKVAAADAYKAAVETARVDRDSNIDKISFYNKLFKLNKVKTSLIEELGLKPDSKRTSTPPTEPLDLVSEGFDNGINRLRWKRNGNKPATQFVIEAMIGDAKEFVQIGVTTKTEFEHQHQKPGVQIIYRVKAVRAGRESVYSNESMLYRKA